MTTTDGGEIAALRRENEALRKRIAAFEAQAHSSDWSASHVELVQWIRRVTEACSVPIAFARDATVVASNDAFVRMYGYESASETLGRPIWDFIAKEAHEEILKRNQSLQSGETVPADFETKGVRRNGSVFSLRIHGVGAKLACGSVAGGFFEDISERLREAQETEQVRRNALLVLERRTRELSSLFAGARLILERDKFSSIARRLLDSATEQVGASCGCLALHHGGGIYDILATKTSHTQFDCQLSLETQTGQLVTQVYRSRTAVFENQLVAAEGIGSSIPGKDVSYNVLVAPLNVEDETIGVAAFWNKLEGFTEEDCNLATAFGNLVGIALRNERNIQALRDGEARYRALFETMVDAVVVLDTQSRTFIDCNPAAEKLYGYSREEFCKLEQSDISAEPEASRQTLQVVSLRLHKRKDGTVFPVESRATAFSYGERALVFAINRDISERLSAENALRESETKYRILVESADDAIALVDLNGNYLYKNRACFTSLGYEPYDPNARDGFSVVHPEDWERIPAAKKVLLSQGVATAEYRARHRDGNFIHRLAKLALVRDAMGVPTSALVIVRDITERKAAEERLRVSEERLRKFFDNAQVGMFRTRLDGTKILDINDTLARILGTTREAAVSKPATIHWVDEDERAQLIRRVTTSGQVSDLECRLRTGNGDVRYCLMSATLDRAQGIIEGSLLDITGRKRAEEERSRLEEQLYHARKMEAIGTLAGGVAHDFNNILCGVLTGLSVLEAELGDRAAKFRPDIEDMIALVRRGADLAKQLLGIGHRGRYDVRPLALADVVRKTGAMFGSSRRDIAICYEFAPELLAVLMDLTQLEQVLINLFLNAAQAMPVGGEITISASNTRLNQDEAALRGIMPGDFVSFVLADTGTGMDAATQARIFEPFFTTKAKGHASGLGLASVYGIVRNHGGMISVKSELDKGAAFTILFPATDRPVVETRPSRVVAPAGTGTILVVDDEEQLRKFGARLLRTMGYDVVTASCGRDAIELVREQSDLFSLVILDLTMPDMSGAETYDALKMIAPEIKVLLASGFTVEGQAQDLLARGCNDFIQKPFDVATLSTKLRSLLGDGDS